MFKPNKTDDNTLGLYVHVPFCAQGKCPYCDFYSLVPSEEKKDSYVAAVIDDLIKQSENFKTRLVDTVYFGGGTPSVLGLKLIKILKAIFENYMVDENAEITFEANPKTINFNTLNELKKAGFNRLSLGMQSANDDELKMLGRRHTKEDVKIIIDEARQAGFTNISVDLMLCVPGQTKKSMLESINYLKILNPEHVSAYLLIVEEGTEFYKNRDKLNLPDDDEQADMYLLCVDELEKLGYMQYEISNFAKKGFESRHNTRYWKTKEYLGFGPSAHSFVDGKRFYYDRNLDDYINRRITKVEGDGVGGTIEEFIMLGLRLSEGINKTDLLKRYNKDFSYFNMKELELLKNNGLINLTEENISLTKKGLLVSNSVISALIFN